MDHKTGKASNPTLRAGACHNIKEKLIPFDYSNTFDDVSQSDCATINISPEILKTLQELATERNNKDTTRVKSQRIANNKSDYDINLEGLMGEFAFSEFSGLPIDTNYYNASDGGVDFSIDNLTIQCKYTPKQDGDLLIPERSNIKANVIVLTSSAGDNIVEIVGYIPTKMFYRKAELKQLNCSTYVLHRDMLRPAVELKDMIKTYLDNGGLN